MPSEKKEESIKDRLVPFENTEDLFDEENKKAYIKLFNHLTKDKKYVMKYKDYRQEFPIQFKKMKYEKVANAIDEEKEQITKYHFQYTDITFGMLSWQFQDIITRKDTEKGTEIEPDLFLTPCQLKKPSDITIYDEKIPIEMIPTKKKDYLLKLSTSYIEVTFDLICDYSDEQIEEPDISIYMFTVKNPEKITEQEKNDILLLPKVGNYQSDTNNIYILPKYFDKNVKTKVNASLYKPVPYKTQKKRQKLMDDVSESEFVQKIPKEVFHDNVMGFLKGTTTGKTVGKKGGKKGGKTKTKKHR